MTARALLTLFALALLVSPLAHAEDAVKKHQESKDPAALKPAGVQTTSAPAKPVAPPPPSGAQVGQAIDAMASSCSKALTLQTEISALAAKVKASKAARTKSNGEMKKKLRAVKASHGKVTRAAKKPGTDAAAMVETARADYESALAESKTFEVETQAMVSAEDQLISLVKAAEESSTACTQYEELVRASALHAKKAVAEAKRNAAKARQMAAIRQEKALAAERAKQAKDLEAVKLETESARTAFETMKTEAASQPAPGAVAEAKKPANAATPAKDPAAANQGKKGEAPGQVKKP
jgi:colicin import membrane protein